MAAAWVRFVGKSVGNSNAVAFLRESACARENAVAVPNEPFPTNAVAVPPFVSTPAESLSPGPPALLEVRGRAWPAILQRPEAQRPAPMSEDRTR